MGGRVKNVIPDKTDFMWQVDFIEIEATNVVDNNIYSENWY